VPFTAGEDAAQMQGLRDYGVGHWEKILLCYSSSFNPQRTAVNLKDRRSCARAGASRVRRRRSIVAANFGWW
jgi:hypothetical protein